MVKRAFSIILIAILVILAFNQEAVSPSNTEINTIQCFEITGYTSHATISIQNNDDFDSQGWPGNGTSDDPYIISGLNITSDDRCIVITNTDVYYRIENCYISSLGARNQLGIYLLNAPFGTVDNCKINSHEEGIRVQDSHHCNVTNNILYYNLYNGIFLSVADYAIVENNTCYDNDQGIILNNSVQGVLRDNNVTLNRNGLTIYSSENSHAYNNSAVANSARGFSLAFSEFCTLQANNATSNIEDGFYVRISDSCNLTDNYARDNDEGYELQESSNIRLESNQAKENSGTGIALDDSHNCLFFQNNLSQNSGAGVQLFGGSSNNHLVLNRIEVNSLGNGFDYVGTNHWDDGVEFGNYWGDYDGSGVYNLDGTGNADDNYPFSCGVVPFLNHPRDITIELGSVGSTVTWSANDVDQATYKIFQNTTQKISEVWDEPFISVSLNGLNVSTYNFTIVVTDTLDNSALDTVYVEVVDTTSPDVDSPVDIVFEEGTPEQFIIWTPFDFDPDSYTIHRDGMLLISESWNGSQVTVNITGLSVGSYTYVLNLYDGSGNSETDTVIVSVIEPVTTATTITSTTTTSPLTAPIPLDATTLVVIALGIGVGVIVLAVVLMKKKS
ncbi:MAG: nitrous oxide reductase family maturation protein NosD [Candidatus Thorarchaeota archaeon]